MHRLRCDDRSQTKQGHRSQQRTARVLEPRLQLDIDEVSGRDDHPLRNGHNVGNSGPARGIVPIEIAEACEDARRSRIPTNTGRAGRSVLTGAVARGLWLFGVNARRAPSPMLKAVLRPVEGDADHDFRPDHDVVSTEVASSAAATFQHDRHGVGVANTTVAKKMTRATHDRRLQRTARACHRPAGRGA